MKNILIIGATGTLGKAVTKTLLTETDANLTLFSRSASRLNISDLKRQKVISGSVLNESDLLDALKGQDAVFVALSGDLESFAKNIVKALDKARVSRLVFITSMGIYNEIPASVGSKGNLEYNSVLTPYRKAADVIEASDLNYTLIRPGWFTSGPVDYEVTKKGEPFGGHDVSIASIADLAKRLLEDDTLYAKESVGINTPQ